MRSRSLFIYSLLSLVFLSCGERTPNETLFNTSFEEEFPFKQWQNDQHCCDHSVTISKEKYTDGKSSVRFEVRRNDPPTSRSIRAELVKNRNKPGDENWYGFNMYLEDWIADNAGEHVFQWHPENSSGIATMALWTSGGRYVLQTNTGGQNHYTDLGEVISNKWTSWVIHVKWESNAAGLIQLWKNGELMIDRKNIVTSTRDGNYFKLGINKFGWGTEASVTEKRVLYFDEVSIADATADYNKVRPAEIEN